MIDTRVLQNSQNLSFRLKGEILTDRSKLPSQESFIRNKNLRRRLGPLVWNKNDRKFIDPNEAMEHFDNVRVNSNIDPFRELTEDPAFYTEFHAKLKHHGINFRNDFSYDVVLSFDDLRKGLGLDENKPRDMIQAMIEERLGINLRPDWRERNVFKNWI